MEKLGVGNRGLSRQTTLTEFKRRVWMGSHSILVVSPVSDCPTFDTDKKTSQKCATLRPGSAAQRGG